MREYLFFLLSFSRPLAVYFLRLSMTVCGEFMWITFRPNFVRFLVQNMLTFKFYYGKRKARPAVTDRALD